MQFVRYNTQTKDINDSAIISDLQFSSEYPCSEFEVWKDLNSPEVIAVFEKRIIEQERADKEAQLNALKEQNPQLFEYFSQQQAKTNEVLDTLILEALNV